MAASVLSLPWCAVAVLLHDVAKPTRRSLDSFRSSLSCHSSIRSPAAGRVVMMSAGPKIDLETSIAEAQAVCADPNNTEECAVAWDEVEEISAELANQKVKKQVAADSDPLEKFCSDNPDSDECRVYED